MVMMQLCRTFTSLPFQERKAELGAFDRVRGLLQAASEELHDCPLYLDLHSVCASLKCTPMKHDTFRSALVNAGAVLPRLSASCFLLDGYTSVCSQP